MSGGRASTIAIDGPAGSGKSTLARRLADELGYLYFDTGVMYRALTLAALRMDVPVEDKEMIGRLAEDTEIDVRPAPGSEPPYIVTLNGEQVTEKIRAPQVDDNVSAVSAYRRVREILSARQRQIGERGRVVMVGRDIGTVVLPDADLKIYLDASLEARAHRRHREMLASGAAPSFGEILESMRERDRIDSTRALAPLKPADDAIVIDNTDLSIERMVQEAMGLVDDSRPRSGDR